MKKIRLHACLALLGTGLFLALSNGAAAAGLADHLRPDHPETYTVVKGDTLWDISGRFLAKPWLWPELWQNNPQIQNPHLIYPGDVIHLIWVNGQPQLSLSRGGGIVKLKPEIRSTPIESAVPAIRMDAIQSFLVQNRVVSETGLDAAPYVVEGQDERLVIGSGDRMYVRGVLPDAERFSVVRKGPLYSDPETGEVLGMEATYLGLTDAIAQEGDIATTQVAEVRQDIRAGDRLLPTEEREHLANFFPRAPAVTVRGEIISVFGGVSQVGPYDVVVLNRGEREGLQVGDTLAIFKRGASVLDPVTKEPLQMPSERAGLVMVFRTFEKLAYGLVLEADRALAIRDEVGNP